LFVVAVTLVITMSLAFFSLWCGVLAAAGFGLLIGRMRHAKAGITVTLLSGIMLAHAAWRNHCQREGEAWIATQIPQRAEGRLLEDAKGEKGRWSAVANIRREGLPDMKVRWLGSGSPPPAGTELRSFGVFKPLEPERNPGVPDRMQMMRAEGIAGSFRANEMRGESWIGPISRKKAAFKAAFHHSITAGLDTESTASKVIRAVVIGEKSPDSLELVRAFLESGTLHVFTVSGLHVAMVASMLWFVLGWLNCPRRAAIPCIIIAMFVYVWITGNGPAAMRAAWMSSVFLGGFMLRRKPDLLNSLGAVLLAAMLWNPDILRFPGVQLSYGVVAAIGLGTAMARRCFDWVAGEHELVPKSELSWLRSKWLKFREDLANSLAVSLAASAGSTPLVMFHFGIITPVSILATVFLVFQVFILLFVALFSALIHPVWPAGSEFLNRNNAVVANACAWTAGAFANIPGAWASTRSPSRDTLVIYDLDYGADAACLASADGNAVMIDTGGTFGLGQTVGKSLGRLGIHPDSVILTHADSGHVAPPGLMREMFPIRQVVLGANSQRSSVIDAWEAHPSARILLPRRGSVFSFAKDIHAEVLLSPHDQPVGSLADDRCLVLMLHWKGWKLLWLGDAGRLSEQALLAGGEDLSADLIIAGIHGSDLSLTTPLIRAVSPDAIIIPRLAASQTDASRREQIQLLQPTRIRIIDREQTGGLLITAEETRLMIRGHLDKSTVELRGRPRKPATQDEKLRTD
jgi:competence protein ComEC